MNRLYTTTLILSFIIISTLTGCAKFPAGPTVSGKQLVLTLKVKGRISPIDEVDPTKRRYYFIAIDNDPDTNIGPLAVAGRPWGNGWVTSKDAVNSRGVTSFLEYDAANPSGNIYSFDPTSSFTRTTSIQIPLRYELLDGGSTLRFTIDFAQITTDTISVDQITNLNINFITTDKLPLDTEGLVVNRQVDGLGPTGQDYVNVDTRQDRTYSGPDVDSGTPPFVITDPDLNIDYWSIQVQTVSSR